MLVHRGNGQKIALGGLEHPGFDGRGDLDSRSAADQGNPGTLDKIDNGHGRRRG